MIITIEIEVNSAENLENYLAQMQTITPTLSLETVVERSLFIAGKSIETKSVSVQ